MPDKESETFYFGYKERRTETDGVDSRSAENYVHMCSNKYSEGNPNKMEYARYNKYALRRG